MNLLFIHGRSQGGRSSTDLQADWLAALAKGLGSNVSLPGSVHVDLAYYATLLDDAARDSQIPVVTKGPVSNDYDQFREEMALELKSGAGIENAEVQSFLDRNEVEKGPANWRWVQAIVRALDKRVTPVASFSIDTFMRDVYLYTRRSDVRKDVNAIVEAKLTSNPTVVVAHSLGTVVAYDVIRTAGDIDNIRMLVTLGSPLGIKAVNRPLRPWKNRLPADVWWNAFDPRDIVALNSLDKANFGVIPGVVNYSGVNNGTPNKHGIVGYLGDREVAANIQAHLR